MNITIRNKKLIVTEYKLQEEISNRDNYINEVLRNNKINEIHNKLNDLELKVIANLEDLCRLREEIKHAREEIEHAIELVHSLTIKSQIKKLCKKLKIIK